MQKLPFIPYFTTSRYRVDTMLRLANPQPHDLGADLGSGDGRIVIAFAKKGITMHGYEMDNMLLETSNQNIQKEKLTNAFIYQKDFWNQNLSSYSIITVYGMPDIMNELELKLSKELRPGARILSNYYTFPNWKSEKHEDSVFLYVK